MANATVINPADGTENNAAPHTEVTSINVPINSAISLRVIVPTSSKRSARHVPKGIRRCLLPRFQPACAASGEPFGAKLGSASSTGLPLPGAVPQLALLRPRREADERDEDAPL